MASIASSNTVLPPSRLSKNNAAVYRNASFSSYLNSPKPKKVDDGEIDVFSADKYFNGGVIKESSTVTVRESNNKTVTNLSKLDLQPKTPSIYSETSLNSQTVLLKRVQRSSSRKKSSFMSCYCCDKKSVDIENNDHGENSMNINEYDHERPIRRTIKTSLDTAEITRLNKLKKIQLEDEDEKEIRRKKSLEVFGSDEGSKRFSLEKRLKMLSWDAIPRSVEQTNTSGAPSETNNDSETDASSDLFEIECLSTRDNNVSGTCTTGYAPSEVSIDWSVVTASEDHRSTVTAVTRGKAGLKPTASVKQRSAGGMLSGCKSQKAVRVAEDVCISSPLNKKSDVHHKMHKFSESYAPVTRFQAEAKLPRHSKTTPSSDILYIF